MATPTVAAISRCGSRVAASDMTTKVTWPGSRRLAPCARERIRQPGGKMLETRTRLQAAIPAVPAEATPKSLVSRIFGVFFSPRATYAGVAARPRWFGALAISCAIVAGGYGVLLSTEVGKQAALDQQTQMLESFGVKLNDA